MPTWSIFGPYVRLLQRGRLPAQTTITKAYARLAAWTLGAALLFAELYTYYNEILLAGTSLLLMLAATPLYLHVTNSRKRTSTMRGGWTGFGTAGAKWFFVIVVVSIVVITATLTGALSFLGSITRPTNPLVSSSGVTLPAGYAFCPGAPPGPGASGSYAYGAQPSNCLPLGMNLQIGLQNLASTSPLSGWTCQIIWNAGNAAVAGAQPGTPGTISETIANTGSNGLCTTAQKLYYPSWSLSVRVCHQTTACSNGSPTYGQQEYVSVQPIPGGTVPFYYGTQAPTTTWTQPFTQLIVPMAGDIAASNTPIKMILQAQNGTVIPTGGTGAVNSATAPAGDTFYFGAGVYINTFTVTLTDTYTTSTFPFVAGYTDFSDPILGIPALGTLSTNLQLEVKQTAGSNPICTVTSGFANSGAPYIRAASVPDAIYVSGTLSTALTVNKPNGYAVTSPGTTAIPFQLNCQTLTAGSHADTNLLTFNLYAYYSVSWVSTNSGTLNTQTAVTQMTAYTETVTS